MTVNAPDNSGTVWRHVTNFWHPCCQTESWTFLLFSPRIFSNKSSNCLCLQNNSDISGTNKDNAKISDSWLPDAQVAHDKAQFSRVQHTLHRQLKGPPCLLPSPLPLTVDSYLMLVLLYNLVKQIPLACFTAGAGKRSTTSQGCSCCKRTMKKIPTKKETGCWVATGEAAARGLTELYSNLATHTPSTIQGNVEDEGNNAWQNSGESVTPCYKENYQFLWTHWVWFEACNYPAVPSGGGQLHQPVIVKMKVADTVD